MGSSRAWMGVLVAIALLLFAANNLYHPRNMGSNNGTLRGGSSLLKRGSPPSRGMVPVTKKDGKQLSRQPDLNQPGKSTNEHETEQAHDESESAVKHEEHQDGEELRASDAKAAVTTPYYSFASDVMPESFKEHLEHLVEKINKKWSKQSWRKYESLSIEDCASVTPECGLFKELENGGDKPYRKCCVEHKRLQETAKWVMAKLDAANITYFLSTGSALGSFRHGGTIIPWDTDVDLAVYPDDKGKIKSLFADNGEHYFHSDPLGKPMYWIHHSHNGKPKGGPHVEIFFDKVYTKYPESLLPLESCDFYGSKAKCPNRKMLSNVWFKSGWKSYGGCHYHGDGHGTEYKMGKKILVRGC